MVSLKRAEGHRKKIHSRRRKRIAKEHEVDYEEDKELLNGEKERCREEKEAMEKEK